MKFTTLFFCFLGIDGLASAHPWAPPTLDRLQRSDEIYVVRADSVKDLHEGFNSQSVTFTVVEVLRGKTRISLILTAVEATRFHQKEECILIHNPSGFPNDVGYTIEGDPEWWPVDVTEDKESHLFAKPLGSLDEVRKYVQDHPYKP